MAGEFLVVCWISFCCCCGCFSFQPAIEDFYLFAILPSLHFSLQLASAKFFKNLHMQMSHTGMILLLETTQTLMTIDFVPKPDVVATAVDKRTPQLLIKFLCFIFIIFSNFFSTHFKWLSWQPLLFP